MTHAKTSHTQTFKCTSSRKVDTTIAFMYRGKNLAKGAVSPYPLCGEKNLSILTMVSKRNKSASVDDIASVVVCKVIRLFGDRPIDQ